ncbi:lectin-like domain-containing protein, partial [Aquimarina longa]|uniref:lectin-like domain-containing protein n=1 Tax=Aquimarina longa TaxID=1080221 RepID=UPI001968448A
MKKNTLHSVLEINQFLKIFINWISVNVILINKINLVFITLLIVPLFFYGQSITNRDVFSGKIDYAIAGSSFRDKPTDISGGVNSRDTNASIATTAPSVLTIPAGVTVEKAYLYWTHGNSVQDNTVTFQDPLGTSHTVVADQSFFDHFDAVEKYFSYIKDVTTIISNSGSGTYTMSDLAIERGGSTNPSTGACNACTPWYQYSTVGGTWMLVVVYEDTINISEIYNINIYDGLKLLLNGSGKDASTTFTLNQLLVDAPVEGNLTMYSFEGDNNPAHTGEGVTINTNQATNVDGVPFGAMHDESNTYANVASSPFRYGIDVDEYNISSYLTVGDTSLDVGLQTGADQIHVIAAITKVKSNDEPVANNDSVTTNQETLININLADDDTDANNNLDLASITIIGGNSTTKGNVVVNSNGTIDYTPNPTETGVDTFTYQICDTSQPTPLCAQATVTVTILPDSDGDGVSDTVDLDDDNDGILDTVECSATNSLALFENLSTTSQSYTIGAYQITQTLSGSQFDTYTDDNGNIALNTNNSYVDISISGNPKVIISPATNAGVNFDTGDQWTIISSGNTFVVNDPSNGLNIISNTIGQIVLNPNSMNPTGWSIEVANVSDIRFLMNIGNTASDLNVQFSLCNDNDNDGIINSLDIDSDNDGIYDVVESGGTASTTIGQEGRHTDDDDNIDNTATNGVPSLANSGAGNTPTNTVGSTPADYLNIDSDGDSCNDANEAYNTDYADYQANSADSNNDGTYGGVVDNTGVTTNGAITGLTYTTDATRLGNVIKSTTIVCELDSDADGVYDVTDLDDDNDGILDTEECTETVNTLSNSDFQLNGVDWSIDSTVSFPNDGGDINLYYYNDNPSGAFPNNVVVRNDNTISIENGQEYNLSFFTAYSSGNPCALNYKFILYNISNSTQFQVVGPNLTTGGSGSIGTQVPVTSAGNNFESVATQIIETFTATVPTGNYYLGFAIAKGGGCGGTGRDIHLDDIIFSSKKCISDTDNDGIINSLDLDSDNDGIYDVIESGGNASTTTGQEGRHTDDDDNIDNTATNGVPSLANSGAGNMPINTEGSTSEDYLNTDSDGDSCSDANEGSNTGTAEGNDGGQYGDNDPQTLVDGEVNSNGLVVAATYSNTPIAEVTDNSVLTACGNSDGDGVDASVEDGAPNGGDGNGDGTPDSQQSNVASIPDATGTGYVTLEVLNAGDCTQISGMKTVLENELASLDADFDYPVGLLDFTLTCGMPNQSADVIIYWHNINTINVFRKYGSSTPGANNATYNSFTATLGTKTINGVTVPTTSYKLTDGQPGDESSTPRIIIDPVGPSMPSVDSDGDSLVNGIDLDDDNDGILDVDECNISSGTFGTELVEDANTIFEITAENDPNILTSLLFGSNTDLTLVSSNINVGDGSVTQVGTFNDGDQVTDSGGNLGAFIGFSKGIIFSSGNVLELDDSLSNQFFENEPTPPFSTTGPALGDGTNGTGSAGNGTDTDFVGGLDVASLEFVINVPVATTLTGEFVFASDEYNDFVNAGVNDAAKIIVNGTNVAVTPSGSLLSIDTVNNTNDSSFYIDNETDPTAVNIEADGFTRTLTFSAVLTAGNNTIKIGVADEGDRLFDSWLILKANSLILCYDKDTDNDTIADRLDLDSDNDGIYDVVESGGILSGATGQEGRHNDDDNNTNNVATNGVPSLANGGAGNTPTDTESNGSLDYLTLDSDSDGCSDANEAYGDANADGGDGGIYNPSNTATEPLTLGAGTVNANGAVVAASYANPTDGDTNSVSDYQQVGGPDSDGDGIPNSCDTIFNDADGDGIGDSVDLDDDNDGITDCEESGITTTSEVNNLFSINGNAQKTTATEFLLTPNLDQQSGQAMSFNRIDFSNNFKISFEANLGTNNNDADFLNSGADGIAIVFHNDPAGATAVGGAGEGIGASGIQNGIVLEIDTFDNSGFGPTSGDIANDHAMIWDSDSQATHLSPAVSFGDIEDGAWHPVEVTWNATSQTLKYTIDGTTAGTYTGDLVTNFFAGEKLVYFGYTASTGSVKNEHKVRFPSGLCTSLPFVRDTDNDGIPNNLDLDSDNDGIYDVIETGGIASTIAGQEGRHADDDNNSNNTATNGIPSLANGGAGNLPTDTLSDSILDYLTLDSDGDGCSDANEAYNSATADGGDTGVYGTDPAIVNANGLVTGAGYTTPVDTDTNNTADYQQAGGPDSDGDGKPNACDLIFNDIDGDGVGDAVDLDNDNDGIPDSNEGCVQFDLTGTIGTSNNQIVNGSNYALPNTTVTYSRSGPSESSIFGTIAGAQGQAIKFSGSSGNNGTLQLNFNNLISNLKFKLTDFDEIEEFEVNIFNENNVLYDLTTTGVVSRGTIISQTGNKFSGTTIESSGGPSVNGDDPNDDSVGSVVFDINGKISRIEINYNFPRGASIRMPISNYCSLDSDGDGVFNHLDLDSDNDGIYDIVETENAALDTNGNGAANGNVGTNGIPDAAEDGAVDGAGVSGTPLNTDNTGNPNYLDIDSDDDGIPDNVEGQATGNYNPPLGTDADNDGIDDQYDTDFTGNNAFTPENTDGADSPDYIDTDSDNDGTGDVVESGQDLGNGLTSDTDGDGLLDRFDDVDTTGATPDVNDNLDA